MPIQINEIIIRAVVDSTSTTATHPGNTPALMSNGADVELAEKILGIIKTKNER